MDVWKVWSGYPFTACGRNSLLIYMIHEMCIGIIPFGYVVIFGWWWIDINLLRIITLLSWFLIGSLPVVLGSLLRIILTVITSTLVFNWILHLFCFVLLKRKKEKKTSFFLRKIIPILGGLDRGWVYFLKWMPTTGLSWCPIYWL